MRLARWTEVLLIAWSRAGSGRKADRCVPLLLMSRRWSILVKRGPLTVERTVRVWIGMMEGLSGLRTVEDMAGTR